MTQANRQTRSMATRLLHRISLSTPMFPEGLSTFVLMIALVTCAGLSIQSAEWPLVIIPLAAIAFAGSVFGGLLAKLRVVDSVAHLLALVLGGLIAFGSVVISTDGLGSDWRSRVGPMIEIVGQWYVGTGRNDDRETYLVSLLLGLIVWLIGYLASWSLFRRGWIAVAVTFPGFLMLITMGYAPEPHKAFIAAYSIIAIPLIARFALFHREREWRRNRLLPVRSLAPKFLLISIAVGVICTAAGWRLSGTLSQEAFQPLVSEVSTNFAQNRNQASQWLRGVTGPQPSQIRLAPFTAFDDSFSVGGPLQLSEQREVLVYADVAPYLAAQRYDAYSGRGWSSTVDATFDNQVPDGRRYSPEMTFRAGQELQLSSNVSSSRAPTTVAVKILGPQTDRMLTVDTFTSSSTGTSVRMSWTQLDDTVFRLDANGQNAIPPDLRGVVNLLHSMTLDGENGAYGPVPTDRDDAARLDEERVNLSMRFLQIRWTANDERKADTLIVTGQIPEYDDVESVFAQNPIKPGTSYQVTGATSTADAGDLMAAGTSYPDGTGRYLQLPATITPRTTELATEITRDSTTPYAAAITIEAYLREHIAYDETVDAPPEGVDMVDYVLFERQRGYCEYYASAMAVMLRTLGIPARVATGYYPGEFDDFEGGFLYRQANAHAWVEAFFPGYGWIRFEPTASQPASQPGAGEQSTVAPEVSAETPNDRIMPSTPSASTPTAEQDQSPAITPIIDTGSGGNHRGAWVAAAFLVALSAAVLGGLGFWLLPFRGMATSGAMFLRLRRLGKIVGVRPLPSATPAEVASSISRVLPAGREHVNRIVHAYELDQYGPTRADSQILNAASDAWSALRRGVPSFLVQRFRRSKATGRR